MSITSSRTAPPFPKLNGPAFPFWQAVAPSPYIVWRRINMTVGSDILVISHPEVRLEHPLCLLVYFLGSDENHFLLAMT
jgi:hypothetical protein